jgi:DNA-binding FadR family transcriptional regulator
MERYEQTLSKLRDLITGEMLAQGHQLPPERLLASELGVGRRTLRRALGVLEGEGRIQRQRGRGTFVNPARPSYETGLDQMLEHTNPIEVMEVRLAVEPIMARLASLRASRCDMERLASLCEETRSATNSTDYEQADAEFHRRIAKASRNTLFLTLYNALSDAQRDASWPTLGENARCFKSQARYASHHAEIVDAITSRDSERAQDVMYNHLRAVQRDISQRVFPENGDD